VKKLSESEFKKRIFKLAMNQGFGSDEKEFYDTYMDGVTFYRVLTEG